MKKIIGALALASLTLGIASADVKFTLNYRTQMVALSRVMTNTPVQFTNGKTGTDLKTATASDLAFVSHLFKHTGYGDAKDNFTVAVSNDFGGAKFRVDPNAGSGNFGNANGKIVEYNGYIKIGNLTISAGLFDGKMNGDYQLKSDADASNLGGETFAAYKLGSIFKNAITTQVDDITSFRGTQKLTGYLSYDAAFGDSKVTVDAAAIGLDTGYGSSADVKSGFALRVNAKVSDGLSGQFIIKQEADNMRALGLHFQPKIGNLKLTLGGAMGFKSGDLEEYNADIRLYYKAGALSITSLNTIARRSDSATASSADYGKHVGAYALNADASANLYAPNKVSNRAMWNVIALRLAVSDGLAITAEAGDIIGFKSNGGTFRDDYGIEAFVAPGLQIFAGKNCSISTCARFGFSGLMLDEDTCGKYSEKCGVTSLLVPVVLRVKL